jgi:alcohol dehydrogenase (cytochrome c)
MMKSAVLFLALAASLMAQGLDPKKLAEPPTDTWPTFNGDYSGRRFSTLNKVNASNIRELSLAWVYRASTGEPAAAGPFSTLTIKSTPLLVNGVLYFTAPDHVWAIDARGGRELWHYAWKSKGGIHIGNRGVGIYENWLYFETPDCHLVSLNLKDGKERWDKEICDLNQQYYASVAPIVVKNHILVGVSGDDLDVPGYLDARDPETGDLQWRFNIEPKKGEPGFESWPNAEAAAHGGGMTWIPGTYDPQLNLYYLGTGNPQPVLAGKGREGDNLYTESIVAINPDTGKLVWYYQPSPHDTHDWDAVQTPILFDGEYDGKPRHLIAQASRNGYFFLLDRATGEHLLTTAYSKTNWSKGLNAKGQPMRDTAKDPAPDGALVSPSSSGSTNWPSPSFDPQTGLFYVSTSRSYSVFYLTDLDEKPEGWAGGDQGVWSKSMVTAIDYKTGKVRWVHPWQTGAGLSGLLSTAGGLLFCGDPSANFIALDPASGKPLWHAGLHTPTSNGPITYELDGVQYVVVGAGDSLYAFSR